MIRRLATAPARPQRRGWRRWFVPLAIVHIEDEGRALVVCETLLTRRSRSLRKRLWRRA